MDLFVQLVIVGVAKGSVYALLAVSFAVIFFTTRTFHLAHGAVFAVAAYFYYLFVSILKLSVIVAIPTTFIVAGFLGVIIETLIYKSLRERYASGTILLLASLSILIFVPSILAILFTANPLFLPPAPLPLVEIGKISIPGLHLAMLGSWVFIGLLFVILQRFGTGMLMRAVADQELVAQAVGIDISRVKLVTTVVGSMLLVPAAVLTSYDVGITPSMGFKAVLLASSCAIMGGAGSLLGAGLSGIIIGVVMRAGVAFTSSMWGEGFAFLALVLVLLFRPQGLFQVKG